MERDDVIYVNRDFSFVNKLTEGERAEVERMEKRFLELAQTANEEMKVNLKEN